MKKTSIRLVLAVAFSAILLGACKKDKDDDEPVGATKENLIGKYKLTSAKYKALGQEGDYVTEMEACEKDNTYELKADFSAVYADAGTKCDPEGGYATEWALNGNSIEIDIYSGTIKSFNGTTLVVEESGTESGITYSITATFVKQ